MMDWTDRHCRAFHRRLMRNGLLYTEMVTTGALLHGAPDRFLELDPTEHPVALQLGGDDPVELAECARRAEGAGFGEVNLNVGCPSSRVQRGRFGACLMRQPEIVARAIVAMRSAVSIPVTVKHRIGVDDADRYDDLRRFVTTVAAAGCETFVVHARKAWLRGLSPRENREIPPLRYEDVYRLKRELPALRIEINGGVASLDEVERHLERVDGVMLGRAAYHTPWILATVDRDVFGDRDAGPWSRREVVEAMVPYLERELAAGEPLHRITRHMLGLYHGQPGARGWRRILSEETRDPEAGVEVLWRALGEVERA
jgi:tRNA-dihydrouridine synthase A